jgi:hypothetical protein
MSRHLHAAELWFEHEPLKSFIPRTENTVCLTVS